MTSIVDMASVKAMKVKPGPLATSSKKTFKSQVALVMDCVSTHLLKLTVAYNEKWNLYSGKNISKNIRLEQVLFLLEIIPVVNAEQVLFKI